MHIGADFNFFLLSFFFFPSVHGLNYLFGITISKENQALIQFTTVFSHPTEHKMKRNELLMPRCQEHDASSGAAEIIDASSSPQKGSTARNQRTQRVAFGFSPCSESGDKPTTRVPHGEAGRESGAALWESWQR